MSMGSSDLIAYHINQKPMTWWDYWKDLNPPETSVTLLISHTPIQNKKFNKKKWLEKAQYSVNLETHSAISWHWVSNMVLGNASLGTKGRKWACTCLPSLLWLIWGIVCVSPFSNFKFCDSRDLILRGDTSNRSHSKRFLLNLSVVFFPVTLNSSYQEVGILLGALALTVRRK